MATIIDNTNYQFVEATHTKKESKLYVIQLKNRVEDKFKLLTRRVENHGGYYSGHQKGFVFNRILSQKEIDEIFKGIFFEEKVELQKVDENKDAWNYTLEELKSIPVSKRGEDTFNFKYNLDGKLVNYSIKVPSGSTDDAFISLAKKIIGNALMSGKYNKAVEKGEMTPVRAAQIIKSLGYSLEQINQDFVELHPDIQAVWSMKKANQEEVLDKVRFPYLYERSEMSHLSDKRYSQIINDAIDSNKYEKLIKDGVVSANKVAFIIESAGFEIPEGLLGEAISERKEEIESLVGGYADSQSIYDISEKHGVPIKEIIRQFKKGLKVEREHTKDKQKMGEIVKDHLVENPYYYDVLIQAEKTMEELDPSKFSSHDDYMKAFSEKEKELEGLSVEERVELKARPIIDKIKYAHKQIVDGVPDEVESFLRNQILNHFISLFNEVVSEYIFYTPVWLDLQVEYLTEKQRNEMLMHGIYNNAHYEEDVVNKFIENVIDSEMIFGSENKKLNNIFDLLPYSPFEVPSELEYELNPKDKNLAEIVDAFVNKGKVLTSTLGVYFGKDGVFASKFTLDIFLKGKKGYLPKNNIEEGIYGLSNSAKNILPAYGAKRLNMLKDKKAIQFFQEYMATYGNEKGEFDKGISVLTHDQIQTMFKDMSVVYSSKAYKDYVKKEVDGLKLKVSSYSILYIKQGANLFTICLHDFIEVLAAIIKMGIDTVQFGVSKNGLYISENVSSLIRLEESGIRVSIKSNESEIPHGMLYYDLNKKEFLTNELGKDSMEDGGDFDNLKKNDKFTDKITKDEINNVISGKSKVRNGDVIQATCMHLRGIEKSNTISEDPKHIKEQEANGLKKYSVLNNIWLSESDYENLAGGGSEQDVYFLDKKTIVKTNYAIYYNSWLDYLNNLLLHNYFFPDTAYELIGFMQKNGFLVSVVKQPLVLTKEKVDLQKVKEFLLNKGFINTKDNDYYNPDLEIILQDLHDENVLSKDGILYFIDTVFYLKKMNGFQMKDGGGVGEIKIGDEVRARWNDSMQWKLGTFIGETENGFEVYDMTIDKPEYIEYYGQISKNPYMGEKIFYSKKFKDRNYKNYNFIKYSDGGDIESDEKKWVDCPKCGGSGELELYRHINAGVCFECSGKGVVPNKSAVEIVERMRLAKKKNAEKRKLENEKQKERDERVWRRRDEFAIDFNNKIIEKVIIPNTTIDDFLKRKDFDGMIGLAEHLKISNGEQFLEAIKDYYKIFLDFNFHFVLEKYLIEKYNYHEYLKSRVPLKDLFYFRDIFYKIHLLPIGINNVDKVKKIINDLVDKYSPQYEKIGRYDDDVIEDRPNMKDGGELSDKPKIVVHNNTNSASDKDAQKIIIEYLNNINDSGHKKFHEFIKKSKQDINDYESFFYVSKDYHDKNSSKFYSNKIIYQKNIEDAYQNALNYDDAEPSFIRKYRHGNIIGYAAVTEFDLFGDWDGDKYDEKGYLKKELKEQAIKQLKKNLFVEGNSEFADGGSVKENKEYDSFIINVKYEVGYCDIDTKGILTSALQKSYKGWDDKIILGDKLKNSDIDLYLIDSKYDNETYKVVYNEYRDEYDTLDNEKDVFNLVEKQIKNITYYTYRSVYKMDERQKSDIKVISVSKVLDKMKDGGELKYNYKNENYIKVEGLTHEQITKMLKEVHENHDDYKHDPFIDMVNLFESDDFYKFHYVAKEYLDMENFINN